MTEYRHVGFIMNVSKIDLITLFNEKDKIPLKKAIFTKIVFYRLSSIRIAQGLAGIFSNL